MSDHDPRVDPRPGDEILWKEYLVRIEKFSRATVWYRVRMPGKKGFQPTVGCYLQTYLRWAADAEVVRKGDEDAK